MNQIDITQLFMLKSKGKIFVLNRHLTRVKETKMIYVELNSLAYDWSHFLTSFFLDWDTMYYFNACLLKLHIYKLSTILGYLVPIKIDWVGSISFATVHNHKYFPLSLLWEPEDVLYWETFARKICSTFPNNF